MQRQFLAFFLGVALATVSWSPARAADAEWPCFMGPNHDSKSLETGLLKTWPEGGPKLLWKAGGIGKGYSSVAVSGGSIYITGDVDTKLMLFAFDMAGKPKWSKDAGPIGSLDHPGSRGSATVDGDRVYLLGPTGLLTCFDAKTGDTKWSKKMVEFGGAPSGWGYAESPLILGEKLIVKPGGAKAVVALDKTTGKEIWASKGITAAPEYSSCVPYTFENVPMITTGTREGIIGLKSETGEVVWTNPFSAGNTANCPSPAYADGYIFWSNGYGKGGICLKLEAGGKATEAWKTKDLVSHHGGYIIDKGYVYGDNGNKGVSCLDLKTGAVKWTDPAVGKGSLCWADGMLYLLSEKNGQAALAVCSPEGTKITGKVKVDGEGPSWAHPVVVGGKLYLRYDATLYCFDVKG